MELFLRYQFKMELITASDVWGFVPRFLTEAQAARICGPRPS